MTTNRENSAAQMRIGYHSTTAQQKIASLSTLLLLAVSARSQGNFIYDQQSSTDETFVSGGAWIQTVLPFGRFHYLGLDQKRSAARSQRLKDWG
jgi:hypothetical protein